MTEVFHALIQSEFTQRAALTLAHALWQGLLVAIVLGIVLRWLRTATAATRHAVACAALLALLAAPIVTFCCLGRPLPLIEDASMGAVSMGSYPAAPTRGVTSNVGATTQLMPFLSDGAAEVAMSSTLPWHAWAVAFWMGGMMMLTIWHGMGWVQLQRLRREGVTPWTDDFGALASRLAKRLGLRAIPRVLWSDRIGGPVAFGCWQAVVLMPASLATGFTMRQIEMILAHEFAHLRRHDYFINLCQTAATTVLFFHPAAWWINRVIRREREHACDDLAIGAIGDAAAYARVLVTLAEQHLTAVPSLAPAAISRKDALRLRIERLLYPLPSRSAFRFWPGILVLLITTLAWLAMPSQPPAAQAAEADPTETTLRGNIRDRNGVILATDDDEHVEIWFRLSDVGIAYAQDHKGDFPRRKRQVNRHSKASTETDDREVPDIVTMFNEVVIPKLEAKNLAVPYNAKQMAVNYQGEAGLPPGVLPEQAKAALSAYGNSDWCYRSDLTAEEDKRARAIAGQVPGMSVHITKSRRYPFAALACHVLGYVNQRNLDSRPIKPNDYGVYGVEKTQDKSLRPSPAGGGQAARKGSDVFLTLDARHQTVIEQTFRDAVPAIGRASAALMEVNTGDVLAMASVSSFDPNDFIPSITKEKFNEYNANETHPLLNRAVRAFTPGSTFMVATSLAAICKGKESFKFNCPGGIQYGNKYMKCWIGQKGGAHGPLDLREAIASSCGPYFFQLGNATGNDAFDTAASLSGLGRKTGIGLEEEVSGIMPFHSWWSVNRPREPFTSATIANISIGQGAVETTPLQLASLLVTVANGGTVWKPRLVDRIAPADDASKAEVQPRVRMADLREHGLTESGMAALRGALEDVVHGEDARAKAAQSPTIRIAGVTGTAQNWRMVGNEAIKDNHTWFVCYAPAEKPRWALAVIVQGGKGGGISAAPVARQILEQVSAIEAGTLKVEPKAMAPVKGSFDTVEEVVLPPLKRAD